MISASTAMTFFASAIALGLAPGPDNIFVLTQSALRGRAAGIIFTLGLCTGLIAQTVAVAVGLAAVFQASAIAFTGLKIIGAGYLLYLAWQALRASARGIRIGEISTLSKRRLYRRGIIMNVTNPKVSIFFLAFLPQFADPARGPLAIQIIALGGLFILATLAVFGGIALLAGTLGWRLAQSHKAERAMNIVAGTVFMALALRLALMQR